jgi:predicted HicB family RNase H-like nuclease
MIEYNGYTGVIEYDPTVERLTGHVVDIADTIYFEGESVTELKASMRRAVDHYLEVCRERGEEPDKPYSGQFRVRMDPDLHRSVAVAAKVDGVSLNTWVLRSLGSALTSVRRRKAG